MLACPSINNSLGPVDGRISTRFCSWSLCENENWKGFRHRDCRHYPSCAKQFPDVIPGLMLGHVKADGHLGMDHINKVDNLVGAREFLNERRMCCYCFQSSVAARYVS